MVSEGVAAQPFLGQLIPVYHHIKADLGFSEQTETASTVVKAAG
jgi:hypothetical protein